MSLTVFGGCGAWPAADSACSGYLVEHDGFRLLVDPGYATLPALLRTLSPTDVDAVLVSHGHPDHCADLNPLLRARALRDDPPPPLPVHTLPHALDAVLALDRPGMLDDAYDLREFHPGDRFTVGPFDITTAALPHFVPNAGFRLSAAGWTLAYTGDTGPSDAIVTLARDADVLLAEASVPERFASPRDAMYLSTARQAAEYATRAGAGRLVLAHLFPDTDPTTALDAASSYSGPVDVATHGLTVR